ncbi:MAG: hypothetical protein FWD13_01895 [Treponema sp.]|nr:hypothetical protein [Treponema sp.]
MMEVKKDSGLSPEQIERIKTVQKRKSLIDPGCEKLTPEEFINWHPVGGMSWEERTRRMKAAGITEPKQFSVKKISENQLAVAAN